VASAGQSTEGIPGFEQGQIRIHLALARVHGAGHCSPDAHAGKELAKTVIVMIDDEVAMAVLPASHQVNLSLLRPTFDMKLWS
jgi:prolyl-tRNA editing enzyme YbaK/EbsC (Cys-tRNA(Pro) deacylase)